MHTDRAKPIRHLGKTLEEPLPVDRPVPGCHVGVTIPRVVLEVEGRQVGLHHAQKTIQSLGAAGKMSVPRVEAHSETRSAKLLADLSPELCPRAESTRDARDHVLQGDCDPQPFGHRQEGLPAGGELPEGGTRSLHIDAVAVRGRMLDARFHSQNGGVGEPPLHALDGANTDGLVKRRDIVLAPIWKVKCRYGQSEGVKSFSDLPKLRVCFAPG